MSLTGYPLAINSRENTNCYAAGDPAVLGFDNFIIPCPGDGGRVESLDWGLPCSENGVSVTGFDYQKAVNNTKPRADAVKVLTISDPKKGGMYMRVLVPDTYTLATFNQACCAGCDPIPAVVIPAPIIGWTECVPPPLVDVACVYWGAISLPNLVTPNTTWVATPTGIDANGQPIVFTPATVQATTAAALAAAMQTGWAAETGNGVFTANGNTIEYSSNNAARLGFQITQI
jgi:hypothetical protein